MYNARVTLDHDGNHSIHQSHHFRDCSIAFICISSVHTFQYSSIAIILLLVQKHYSIVSMRHRLTDTEGQRKIIAVTPAICPICGYISFKQEFIFKIYCDKFLVFPQSRLINISSFCQLYH